MHTPNITSASWHSTLRLWVKQDMMLPPLTLPAIAIIRVIIAREEAGRKRRRSIGLKRLSRDDGK